MSVMGLAALVLGTGAIGGIGAKGNKGDVAAGIQSVKDMYGNKMELSRMNKALSTRNILNQYKYGLENLFSTSKDTMSKIFDVGGKTIVDSNMATIEDPTTPMVKTAYGQHISDINKQIDTRNIGIEQADIASIGAELTATEERDRELAEWKQVPTTFWEGFTSSFG